MLQLHNITVDAYIPGMRHVAPLSPQHCFFSTEDESVITALTRPYHHFLEMHEYIQLGHVLTFIGKEYPHESLSISTKTAFNQPIAEYFTAYLAKKRRLSPGLLHDIQTCLQEAIMNAVIHGNLRMHKNYREMHQFQNYWDDISIALEESNSATKRICIYAWHTLDHLTITVADQGIGFSLQYPTQGIDAPFGRGLEIIRNLSQAWQNQANHITMQFNAHG